MWGNVSEFTNVMGRQTLVVSHEEIPEDAVVYMIKYYFDVSSGLLLRAEVASYYIRVSNNITTTLEFQIISVLRSQTVLDTFFPAIDHPPDLTYEEGTPGQIIAWNPSYTHPDAYSIRQDKVFVDAGPLDSPEISVDVSALSPGVHEYTCYVNDESGQMAMDTIQVTVLSREDEKDGVPGSI